MMILASNVTILSSDVQNRNGFHSMHVEEICGVFNPRGLWIGPRPQLEVDDRFRQIIPYTVFVDMERTSVLTYRRTKVGEETRLHGQRSIGVGGHIDFSDVVMNGSGSIDFLATISQAARREVEEEIGRFLPYPKWKGLLVDNRTDVSRVHIGILGICRVVLRDTKSSDPSVGNVEIVPIDELTALDPEWESWSAFAIPHLRELVK